MPGLDADVRARLCALMTDTPHDTPPDPKAFWAERYATATTPWERTAAHPAFAAWQDAGLFAAGAHIIVPGCGRSVEVVELARLGLTVTAIEFVDETLEWQQARLTEAGLSANLVRADALAWRPDTPADLIYEQTFLCAIHPRARLAYEDAVHAWLKPGGRLLALFMQKAEMGGPPYSCALDAMHTLFPDERWGWPDGEPLRTVHEELDLAELAVALERR